MGREWMLLVLSVSGSIVLALALLRWLAPELLGAPPDLRIVRVADEVPPFFENLFGEEQGPGVPFVLQDPHTLVRLRPLFPDVGDGRYGGPNDLLGFRNRAVPNHADVIAIGDSQTYGNNALLEANWPSRLEDALEPHGAVIYSMAAGGWGAVQYLDMYSKAGVFRPRVVIVAFYSGNDPMESFRLAYGIEKWSGLRPDPALSLSDRPDPAHRNAQWQTELSSGMQIVFTPWLRLYSIRESPAVDAGWDIMAEVARRIAADAAGRGVHAVFTLIPTKELVYAPLLRGDGATVNQPYVDLVTIEERRIARLRRTLSALEGGSYVDLLKPLQQAVLDGIETHPLYVQGHPNPTGYELIARTLAPEVGARLAATAGAPSAVD
jgi:hypothetical protein